MASKGKTGQPSQLRPQTRFVDFDAMMREGRHDMMTIRVYGKDYTIPAIMPAYVPVMLARYGGDELMTRKIIYDAAFLLFGEDAVHEILSNPARMTDQQMQDLVMETFKLINGDPDEAEPQEVNEGDEGIKNAPK